MMDNLSTEEILNYLMTSDFNEGLTPDEYRFLLFQFRNHYRMISGRNEHLKSDVISKSERIKEISDLKDKEINNVLSQKAELENQFGQLKNRQLSWKERWTGKIITQDETK
jgi:hypothetical protein